MMRWILSFIVMMITIYVAYWGTFLYMALWSTGGQLIVATEGTTLEVVSNGIKVMHGSAGAVGVSRPVLWLIAGWYCVLAILALVGCWLLASGRHRGKPNSP